MPRSFDDIARLDRRWFRAHPERRHRCRRPETGEADLYGRDRSGRLIIAVRHLGRRVGRVAKVVEIGTARVRNGMVVGSGGEVKVAG